MDQNKLTDELKTHSLILMKKIFDQNQWYTFDCASSKLYTIQIYMLTSCYSISIAIYILNRKKSFICIHFVCMIYIWPKSTLWLL